MFVNVLRANEIKLPQNWITTDPTLYSTYKRHTLNITHATNNHKKA